MEADAKVVKDDLVDSEITAASMARNLNAEEDVHVSEVNDLG